MQLLKSALGLLVALPLVLSVAGCGGSVSADPFTVSGVRSSVVCSPNTGIATDGLARSTVTVTVRNGLGQAMVGHTVHLDVTGTGVTVTQPSDVSDANGEAVGYVRSTVAGTKVVTVTIDPGIDQVVVTDLPTIVFGSGTPAFTVDHNTINLAAIPAQYLTAAKQNLHILYAHTSHGSQLIDGMTGLATWKGSAYAWNKGGSGGALDLDDRNGGFGTAADLGNPNFTAWSASTRSFLAADTTRRNVVMWAWCGQLSTATSQNVTDYIRQMETLERDFPSVTFVYMTGHLDGTGTNGNLNLRNEQIREYCRTKNKVLFDFADIESYDPDGNAYLAKGANDACDYDSDGNGSLDKNWATDWQNSHTINVDWYDCGSAHSQPLNANRKAYAAWYLFARIAGWNGS